MEIKSTDAFRAIYIAFLGKDHGPKAAWLLQSLDPEFVKERLVKVLTSLQITLENKKILSKPQ